MLTESIALIEMPEHNSISVCVYIEQDEIFKFGESINSKFEDAYMNGYNWDALITFYVNEKDPELSAEIDTDPEAGMFSAYMDHNSENLLKMKKYESYIHTLLSDEARLEKYISDNYEKIEWD